MRVFSLLRIFLPVFVASSILASPANLQVDTITHVVTATDGSTIMDAKGVTLTVGGFTIYDGAGVKTVITGSVSGAMFGASGNKIGFLGATPILRPIGTTDLRQALINLGLYTTGGATPLNLNGGAFTSGTIAGSNETLSGTLGVTGNSTFSGTVGITGAATGSSLALSGDETVEGALTITGVITGSSLTLSGNGSVGGTFAVAGASTLHAISGIDETLSGTLGVTGNSTFGGTLGITGAISGSSFSFTGNGTVGGTFGVSGASTFSTLAATTGTFSGAVSAPNYGAVNGTTGTFSSSISATNATFSGSLTASSGAFSGNETVGGTFGVTGATTLNALTATTGVFSGAVSGSSFTGSGPAITIIANGSAVSRTLSAHVNDFANVKDFGAVGDGITNDTVAIEAARAYANTSDRDIFFPTGTYLITPGGVDWFKCNIYASGATFQAATSADLPLLKINFTGKSFSLDLRAIVGTGPTAGTGVYILGADNSFLRIGSVGNFRVGIHFDGSGANVHIATNDVFVQTIGGCGIGLLMSSANGYACESNRVYINYAYDCSVAAAKLSNGAFGTGVSDNIIEFVSLELHPTGDGIVVESAAASNRGSVKGILGPGGGSTGKYLVTSANNNLWTLPNFSLSRITKTGNDVIDTITNGVDDGSARSQISGSAPPASGTWRIGDICWNNTSRSPTGWRCAISGTPGTWVSLGAEVDSFFLSGNWGGGSVDADYGTLQVGVNTDQNYGAIFGARRDAGGGVHARLGVKTGGTFNNGLDIFSDGGVVLSAGLPTSDPGAGGFGADNITLRPLGAPTISEGRIYYNGTDHHFYGYNGTTWKQLDN